jgi:hypothetical protein
LPHRIETARLNRSPGSHKGQGLLAVGADHSQLNSGLNPRSRLTAPQKLGLGLKERLSFNWVSSWGSSREVG